MTTVPWRLWQIKSQAKRRICWSPRMRNSLRSSLLACFLDLCWPLQLQAAMNTLCFLLRAVFLITNSFPGMETQVVPQINTIKTRLDSFLYLYSTPIALLIKGNNPQNTFQVVWMSLCVGGWLQEGRGGSFYSYFPLRQISLNSFHITYRSFCVCVPPAGSCPNPLHKRRRL